MKKILSLMTLLLLTVATAWAEVKDVTYALQKDDAFASGTTVNVTKDDVTVATITYGEDGGADFKAAKANGSVDGFTAFTEGNGTNGNQPGGTFYTIVPSYDGTIDIAVVINKDKTLIVEEDGVSMGGFVEQTEKLYGIQTFNVKAGKSYKCYVSGSKMGFYGFKYTWEEAPAPASKTVYFDNSKSNWETVKAYAWYNDGTDHEVSGTWPGDAMSYDEGTHLWSWSTDESPTKIIFNNGNKDNIEKTADLEFVDGENYTKDGRVLTVNFKTNCDWSTAYAYTFTGETPGLGSWPGREMTPANEEGTWTITFEAASAPEKIIFNDGGTNQTSDEGWDFEDGKTYEYMMNEYTATFTTDANWATVKAYVWTGEGENEYLGDWPGTVLTANEGVYTVTIKTWGDAPEKIQFNNDDNGQQTRDMAFTDGRAYKWITKTPLYAISSNQAAIASGTTFEVKDAENDVVATLTYGEDVEGAAEFGGATNGNGANDDYAGFEYMTVGNGTDGHKAGGTFYTIAPVYDGTITVGVRLNGGKKFYIEEDGTAMTGYNGITIAEATNTSYSFPVKAGSEYKVYCSGSKLGFFGFDYTGYTKPEPNFKVAGSMTGWTPIKVYDADSYTFNLEAGTYQFKVIDGDAWKGYSDLTEVAAGLYADGGDNICFELPEAGNVTVNYKSGELFTVVGVPELKFQIAGSMTNWEENKIDVYDADSYTFENLAAGTYQFKVVDGDSWKGIADMTEVAGGLYWDKDGNVCFKLAEAGNVTVNYKSGELFTVEGNFVAPTVALAGSMNEWSASANVLVPAEDKKTASVTIPLDAQDYALKMVVDGSWLAKDAEYELNRDNSSVEHVDQAINAGPNIVLKADVAGDYTFTWEYATNTLTVTYPVKLPTVALAGSMNSWSATANVLEPAADKQTASVTVALDAQDYELKMVVDGHWLAKDGEYVLHRNWTSVDNVDQEIAMGPNIVLQADYAGDYTFTWEYATNTLTVTFPTPSGELTLSEETDNSAVLTTWDGCVADVTLNRTLVGDTWNTLALPFTISSDDFSTLQTLLAGQATISLKELTDASFDGTDVTLTFDDADGIQAGHPYLVKVSKDINLATLPATIDAAIALSGLPLNNPFKNVEISKDIVPVETNYIDFIPTLGKTTIDGVAADDVLFLAAGNKLKNPEQIPTDMKGFRAYFQLKAAAEGARAFNLDLGEGETTGISSMHNSECIMHNEYFDLQGRKVQNAAQKGIYIMNGRKVVNK